MDPSSSSGDNPSMRELTQNRQLPLLPTEGGLNELQNESKLYAGCYREWL